MKKPAAPQETLAVVGLSIIVMALFAWIGLHPYKDIDNPAVTNAFNAEFQQDLNSLGVIDVDLNQEVIDYWIKPGKRGQIPLVAAMFKEGVPQDVRKITWNEGRFDLSQPLLGGRKHGEEYLRDATRLAKATMAQIHKNSAAMAIKDAKITTSN